MNTDEHMNPRQCAARGHPHSQVSKVMPEGWYFCPICRKPVRERDTIHARVD